MNWFDEIVAWLAERLVYDEVGLELNRMSQSLKTGELNDRLAAVKQLTFLSAADSIPLLIGALRDSAPQVRASAATGLGYKRSSDAITPLAVLLADPSSAV